MGFPHLGGPGSPVHCHVTSSADGGVMALFTRTALQVHQPAECSCFWSLTTRSAFPREQVEPDSALATGPLALGENERNDTVGRLLAKEEPVRVHEDGCLHQHHGISATVFQGLMHAEHQKQNAVESRCHCTLLQAPQQEPHAAPVHAPGIRIVGCPAAASPAPPNAHVAAPAHAHVPNVERSPACARGTDEDGGGAKVVAASSRNPETGSHSAAAAASAAPRTGLQFGRRSPEVATLTPQQPKQEQREGKKAPDAQTPPVGSAAAVQSAVAALQQAAASLMGPAPHAPSMGPGVRHAGGPAAATTAVTATPAASPGGPLPGPSAQVPHPGPASLAPPPAPASAPPVMMSSSATATTSTAAAGPSPAPAAGGGPVRPRLPPARVPSQPQGQPSWMKSRADDFDDLFTPLPSAPSSKGDTSQAGGAASRAGSLLHPGGSSGAQASAAGAGASGAAALEVAGGSDRKPVGKKVRLAPGTACCSEVDEEEISFCSHNCLPMDQRIDGYQPGAIGHVTSACSRPRIGKQARRRAGWRRGRRASGGRRPSAGSGGRGGGSSTPVICEGDHSSRCRKQRCTASGGC